MTERNFRAVTRLSAWARAQDRGVNELAQAWLLAQAPVCSVITGAKRAEQLISNLRAADWNLTAEQVKEIDAILRSPGD
jgi:aryl-alcohol dehydrogenase-like predicted oxidoreductase